MNQGPEEVEFVFDPREEANDIQEMHKSGQVPKPTFVQTEIKKEVNEEEQFTAFLARYLNSLGIRTATAQAALGRTGFYQRTQIKIALAVTLKECPSYIQKVLEGVDEGRRLIAREYFREFILELERRNF